MSAKFGYGLIGCGEIAVQTSKALLASQLCRVVHCLDIRKELAEDLAGKHGAKHTTKLNELLADKDVQAVVISTPHALHAPLAIQAMRAGKHALVEKPMAVSLTQADEMIAVANETRRNLGTFFPMRLGFHVRKARQLVAGGAIGRVTSYQMHAMACKPESYWHGGFTGRCQDDWRIYLSSSGGGILIMNLVHNLDSMVSVLDPKPQRIYAEYSTLTTKVEVEDYLSFVMRLRGGPLLIDGALVSLDSSSASPGRESYGDRIYGEKGQIAFTRTNFGAFTASSGRKGLSVYLEAPWKDPASGQTIPAEEWIELPPDSDANGRMIFLEAFAKAIQEGRPAPVDGPEGRRSLEIIRGAYLSMNCGKPVEFPVVETA